MSDFAQQRFNLGAFCPTLLSTGRNFVGKLPINYLLRPEEVETEKRKSPNIVSSKPIFYVLFLYMLLYSISISLSSISRNLKHNSHLNISLHLVR